MLTGQHYIAGQWIESAERFKSDPATGEPESFCIGTTDLVEQAADAANAAFADYSRTSREDRAIFLERIGDEIDSLGDAITGIGSAETGLPAARLQGERNRTVGQLRLFATHIRDGACLDHRHDAALPDRQPLPRPDLRMIQRPVGPVAVFGASNFPLAFSVAGGDTASALAAGCPVIVKGHAAHPGTSEIVARAISAAQKALGMPSGVFSLVQGDRPETGVALVEHPLIQAVGFTGSLSGGRALFDLCAARPVPIPFFGELGSINPVFVLPHAADTRAAPLGVDWAASLTMGAGQFCTNPGIVFIEDRNADAFIDAAAQALAAIDEQTMLTRAIAQACHAGAERLAQIDTMRQVVGRESTPRGAFPYLFETSLTTWNKEPELAREVFGPLGIVVRVTSADQYQEIAAGLEGQLTVTLQMDAEDRSRAATLLPVLERKAGRILANGFPTGVEVCDAMVHGGPYPASTNFGATSVGTLAIRRWLRPVCYQAIPETLLPDHA